jgi:hypothetical protein
MANYVPRGGKERKSSLCAVLMSRYNGEMANYALRGGKERKLFLCAVLINSYNGRWLTRCSAVE